MGNMNREEKILYQIDIDGYISATKDEIETAKRDVLRLKGELVGYERIKKTIERLNQLEQERYNAGDLL